jgi:hypothetical protein
MPNAGDILPQHQERRPRDGHRSLEDGLRGQAPEGGDFFYSAALLA